MWKEVKDHKLKDVVASSIATALSDGCDLNRQERATLAREVRQQLEPMAALPPAAEASTQEAVKKESNKCSD
jgi:xanthine dehydrogenase molybdopterin-binding subunit B